MCGLVIMYRLLAHEASLPRGFFHTIYSTTKTALPPKYLLKLSPPLPHLHAAAPLQAATYTLPAQLQPLCSLPSALRTGTEKCSVSVYQMFVEGGCKAQDMGHQWSAHFSFISLSPGIWDSRKILDSLIYTSALEMSCLFPSQGICT